MQSYDLEAIVLEDIKYRIVEPAHQNNFITYLINYSLEYSNRPVLIMNNLPSGGIYYKIYHYTDKLCIQIPYCTAVGYHVAKVIEHSPKNLRLQLSCTSSYTTLICHTYGIFYDVHDPTSLSRVVEDSITIMKIIESLRLYRLNYYDRHMGMLSIKQERNMISSVASSIWS